MYVVCYHMRTCYTGADSEDDYLFQMFSWEIWKEHIFTRKSRVSPETSVICFFKRNRTDAYEGTTMLY